MSDISEARTAASDLSSADSVRPKQAQQNARNQKRLTLTLPLQPGLPPSPQKSGLTSPIRFTTSSAREEYENGESTAEEDLLTAIAAKERRVLELKEELLKAEKSLYKLKKDWAIQEVHKKRQESRRLRMVRSGANTPVAEHATSPDLNDRAALLAQQAEKRRSMHLNTRTHRRTVFSGSKHARTLSLLSPDAQPMSPRYFPVASPERSLQRPAPDDDRSLRVAKLPPSRIVSGEMQRVPSNEMPKDADISRDVLLRAGKQMATDFKDGLWTFLEDLRQVTIGDEAAASEGSRPKPNRADTANKGRPGTKDMRANGAGPRTKPKQQKRVEIAAGSTDGEAVSSPQDSAMGSQNSDKEPELDIQQSPITRKSPRRRSGIQSAKLRATPMKKVDADGWDMWDTPRDQTASAVAGAEGRPAEPVRKASDIRALLDNALEDDQKRDPLPWPALASLAPTNLRRTASHIMTEWERSVSPHDRVPADETFEPGLDVPFT